MKKMLVFIMLGVSILSGRVCASEEINVQPQLDEKLKNFKNIEIQVVPLDEKTVYDAAKMEVDLIHSLRDSRNFTSIAAASKDDPSADLLLRIVFTKFNRVEKHTQGQHGLLSLAIDQRGEIAYTADFISGQSRSSIGIMKFDAIAQDSPYTSSDAITQAIKLINDYTKVNL